MLSLLQQAVPSAPYDHSKELGVRSQSAFMREIAGLFTGTSSHTSGYLGVFSECGRNQMTWSHH